MSIGYACIIQRNTDYNLRTCTLKNASDDNLSFLIKHNLNVLDKMIDYNISNKIKLFRISSDIIPFGSHPVNKLLWWEEHKDFLLNIGEKIKKNKIRVSMHPGQYTIINSPDQDVVKRAVDDLHYHTLFLDSLNVDEKNKLILHIGGVYGDKVASMDRFMQNFHLLPENTRNRLVIENDEKCFNIEDMLKISHTLGIPVVFDNLHNFINPPSIDKPYTYFMEQCQKTWKEKDGKQKIHYSQQNPAGKPGSHSQTIYIDSFMDFYNTLTNKNIDIMLEVKDKNISALKCILSTSENLIFTAIEKEWARYKYLVLSHSHNTYLELRNMLKDKIAFSAKSFYRTIEEGLKIPPNKGSHTNAALHIWGYFKNTAKEIEISKFNSLMHEFNKGNIDIAHIKRYLLKLAIKYEVEYLIECYYFL